MDKKKQLIEALRKLLTKKRPSSQEAICLALAAAGHEVNQTKVSRLLHQIGAVKIKNEEGQIVYSLLKDPVPLSVHSPIRELILEILSNETMVVIVTTPGSASMIARLIDYSQIVTGILGTLAGDDTIFVSPKFVQETPLLCAEISKLLLE